MSKKIFAVIAIFCGMMGIAQKNNSSPYSYFGIGDPLTLKSVEEMSMGRIGVSNDSPFQLSLTNPASYGSLLYTTYVFSGGNKMTNFEDGNDTQTSSHAGFTYLALGIPLGENQGMAFGLQLNTSVGYSLLSYSLDEEENIIQVDEFEGSGGTNRVFLGYGYKFPFGLSLGAETAYIFGSLDNSIRNRRLGIQLATKYRVDSWVDGFEFKTGAQYTAPLANELKLKLGVSAVLGTDLTEDSDEVLYSINNTPSNNEIIIDTLYTNNYRSTITFPLKTVLGGGVGKENVWFAGIEYEWMDAISLEGDFYDQQTTYQYTESSRLSLGGSFIPNFNAISNYWQRIEYRAGFSYKKLGLTITDTALNDYGITFGVGLPVGFQLSRVNLGFELGTRGENKDNLVKENYFNFRLSLSLSDKWFRKRELY